MKGIMDKLSNERKLFHSEADFQLALAWIIKENYPDYEIFLEWRDKIGNKYRYFDIVLEKDEKIIPIELKYKTKKLEFHSFNLKTQSANDLACYDYLKDIQRVESLMKSPKFEKGYTIFLTNDLGYLKEPNPNAGYKEFSIHDGRKINEECSLNWGESSGKGTRKGREDPITLKFDYHFKWKDYSNLNSQLRNDEFKYLLCEINGIRREIFTKERFMLAPSGVFVRDMKHLKSYGTIDEIIDLMNSVNESDNRAVEIIKKELEKQDDKNVKRVLMEILDSIKH